MADDNMPGGRRPLNNGDTLGNEMRTVYLQSTDGHHFELPKDLALMNGLVDMMLENDLPFQQDSDETSDDQQVAVVPLMDVSSDQLQKIVEWMKKHAESLREFTATERGYDDLFKTECDDENFDVDKHELFDLILAANYLDNKPLLNILCARVAEDIQGLTVEEKQEYFELQGPSLDFNN